MQLKPTFFKYICLVSAKIRLLDTTEKTIEFMQSLEAAGVCAITGMYAYATH